MKAFLIVGIGSFFGGGMRFLVSRWMRHVALLSLPMGTLTANVVGCFLIGFFSGLPVGERWMSQETKLLLTTGLCGGFTTFSTFMNENHALLREGQFTTLALYAALSLCLGLVAVVAGLQLAKTVQ